MNYGKKGASRKDKHIASTGTLIRKKFTVIFCKALLVCFLALLVIGGCAGVGVLKGIIDAAPDIDDIDPTPTGYLSVVLDDAGNETATLVASGSNRVYVTLDEIPVDMQHAFVAIEDERFYEHNGIDIKGIIRAGFTGITTGHFSQGASTITQQLLKNNVFEGWTDESWSEKVERKIQEQYLAVQLTKVKSKEWVLENYLNSINLGQNTLGVQAASRRYFGKDVSELTLSESAVIAGITKNPSAYNPVSNPEKNAERRKLVLKNMKDQGYITDKEYEDALADDVYSRIQQVNVEYAETDPNSYFVDALIDQVVQDLVEKKGYTDTQAYKAIYNGGLTIESTQNMAMQQICDEEANNPENYAGDVEYSFSYRLTVNKADGTTENYSEQTMLSYYQHANPNYGINFSSQEEAQAAIDAYKAEIMSDGDTIGGESVLFTLQPQAAMTIIDQSTGEVKAIVGGRGDKTGSRTLNRATDTTRQPGSTFKVLAAYAPALDTAGMTLATVQDDAPFTYSNGTSLRNYDDTYRGFTTLRFAITKSINVVTVKTLTDISPQVGYDYLENFGFTTLDSKNDINQSLALGGIYNGVTNLELTAAYATIADGGTYTRPRFYTRILDHDGNVLIDNTAETHTVLKETTAFLLTDAMKDVVTVGTGTRANFGNMAIAGKTGTTTKNRDALFAGFTPYYTCVVWCGYDDNSPQNKSGQTNTPKNLWKNVMGRIHENLEYKDFTQPDGIVTATVCKKSGKLAVEGLCDCDPRGSMVETEYFAAGTEPTEVCDHHISATICTVSGMLANEFCPTENRQTSVYIIGGSPNTEDGPYLLTDTQNQCTVHTAASVIPQIPAIDPTQNSTPDETGDRKPNGDQNKSPSDNNDSDNSNTPLDNSTIDTDDD